MSILLRVLSLETKPKHYNVIFLCKFKKLGFFPQKLSLRSMANAFKTDQQNNISKVGRWKSFSKIRIGKLGCVLEKFTRLDGGVSATTTSFVWNIRVHLTNFSTLQIFTNQVLWETVPFTVKITTLLLSYCNKCNTSIYGRNI